MMVLAGPVIAGDRPTLGSCSATGKACGFKLVPPVASNGFALGLCTPCQ